MNFQKNPQSNYFKFFKFTCIWIERWKGTTKMDIPLYPSTNLNSRDHTPSENAFSRPLTSSKTRERLSRSEKDTRCSNKWRHSRLCIASNMLVGTRGQETAWWRAIKKERARERERQRERAYACQKDRDGARKGEGERKRVSVCMHRRCKIQ